VRFRPDSPSIYLPNSGQIDLNAIGVEAGQANNSQTALNDAAVRGLIGKASGAQNAMNEYYGASSSVIDITAEACVASEWSNGSSSSTQSCGVGGDGAGWPELRSSGNSYFYANLTKVAGKTGNVLVSGRVYVATWTAQIKGGDSSANAPFFAIRQGCDTTRGHKGWQATPFYNRSGDMEILWTLKYLEPMPTAWTTFSGTTDFTCKKSGPVGITIDGADGKTMNVRNYSIVITEK